MEAWMSGVQIRRKGKKVPLRLSRRLKLVQLEPLSTCNLAGIQQRVPPISRQKKESNKEVKNSPSKLAITLRHEFDWVLC